MKVEQLKTKYAYNINDISKRKKSSIGSGADFRKLNQGFYEEIARNDISIKEKEKQLQKIKNSSLKEFVFANKKIPTKWKQKTGYQNNVIKILAKDNDFLLYIGQGGGGSRQETLSTRLGTLDKFKKKKEKFKTCYGSKFPKINNNRSSSSNLKSRKSNDTKMFDDENISINENKTSSSKAYSTKMKGGIKKSNFNDKDIINLLEEFRIAYPLTIKKEKDNEVIDEEKNNEKNETKANLIYSEVNQTSRLNKRFNSSGSHYKLKFQRQSSFRQNIFNNLIPPQKIGESKSMIEIKKSSKPEKVGPFLNFDNESFYKRITINNPVIQQQLENINFYGPYYAYCPPCLNKNLEFYNNIEPNQCLKIIQYIRKFRGKNNFLKVEGKSKKEIETGSEKNTTEKILKENEEVE
jgi:hypothetical protein